MKLRIYFILQFQNNSLHKSWNSEFSIFSCFFYLRTNIFAAFRS